VVNEAWSENFPHLEPCHVLFHKFKHLGTKLRRWCQTFSSSAKLHLHMALEVILRSNVAQESRIVPPEESNLRKRLRRRVISWWFLTGQGKKQCARIKFLKGAMQIQIILDKDKC
jgi:hypothetical protein